MPGMVEAQHAFSETTSPPDAIQRMRRKEHISCGARVAKRYLDIGLDQLRRARGGQAEAGCAVIAIAINDGTIARPRISRASQEITVAGRPRHTTQPHLPQPEFASARSSARRGDAPSCVRMFREVRGSTPFEDQPSGELDQTGMPAR